MAYSRKFLRWRASRPAAIRALIEKFPPDLPVRVCGGYYKGWIYSYDEPLDGGPPQLKVDIEDPLFPRRVFGLTEEQIEPWRDDV